MNNGSCIYADTIATVSYKDDIDWDYYAKSYKHPKVTISDRKISFKSKEGIKEIDLDNFKGDFMLNGYIKAFNIKKISVPRAEKKIQLNEYLGIKKISSLAGVDVYVRTLNNCIYDYCAVKDKTTL